ncbi:hypothetical protein F5144DRAFT_287753 [Chaetomium tenue]|uniref:Uncharacterized protein n=1 Tax=Chaetomium tenue TaxID=1854479 RepID=A0ACB7P208_9PEZI|nr:hypothetical protein F5144DRAFT_287753 [Chaetomium globosum]
MTTMETANAHYHNGHQQTGPLPASPTLTNPDMILPDYDRSDSPDPDLGSAERASLMMWKNTHNTTSPPDMHHMFVATGLAGPHPYGPSGPVTPTTPIIYGNGTMLSDIGEVTEVESTVGKPSPARAKLGLRRTASPKHGGGSGGEPALQSSPTIHAAGTIKKKSKQNLNAKHERHSSMDSTSTITNGDHAAAFADFDDSVSVGDSVFQGDDEESMASSYVEGTAAVEPARLGVSKAENLDRLSTYSTTSLSRRAEEILANAKRRLTTMEGNLTRARSSLHSPYGSNGSTPSPPFQRAATATYHIEHRMEQDVENRVEQDAANGMEPDPSTPDHTTGHNRMSSELLMRNGLPYRVNVPRSQSALGAAGGYRQPLTASKSADHIRGGVDGEPHRTIHKANSVREVGLKPLTEDEVARLGEADSASHNARLEAFLSPTFGSPTFGSFHSDSGARNPQRSSSAVQMRDIKDQMRDLKGKISNLREQARVDNMKRQSLQSLRTPSPFTHSQIDHWYAEPPSNRASEIVANDFPDQTPWNDEGLSVNGDIKEVDQQLDNGHVDGEETDYADAEEGVHIENPVDLEPRSLTPIAGLDDVEGDAEDDVSDMHTENGDTDEAFHDAADADVMSESGESLYHDTVQHQISHEDREDAFDYEHFFLHSAMGTMSMARRASRESFTSDDSVETTRGPTATSSDEHPPIIGRRNSSNSISTIDTFATAQEARSLKSPVSPDEGHNPFESLSRAASSQSHRYRSGSSATAKRLSFNPGALHPPTSGPATRDSDGSISPIAEESSSAGSPAQPKTERRASVIHRPMSTTGMHPSLHRPSTSSFDSVGTNRSFPLVNKPPSRPSSKNGPPPPVVRKASSAGVLTPPNRSLSPDVSGGGGEADLNTLASRLMLEMGQHAQPPQSPTSDRHVAMDGDAATNGINGIVNGIHSNGGGGNGAPHPLEALLREDKYLVERIVANLGRCVLGLTENGRASAESRMYRRRLDAARRALEGLGLGEENLG